LRINRRGLLIRKIQDPNTLEKREQLVLPEKYRQEVLKLLHNDMGHMCPERTATLVQERFFWPYMTPEITDYLSKKCSCLKDKPPARHLRAYKRQHLSSSSRLISSTWKRAAEAMNTSNW
jgi:hypothetical protein